jgi:hypothetical protein
MDAIDPTLGPLLALLDGGGPTLVAIALGYALARRVLADLCRTVPEAIDVGRTAAGALDKIAREGIKIHVDDQKADK